MADGSFPGLVSRDRNVNSQTNSIWVRLTDDTNDVEIGGGVEAAALRVTLASDSTGLLSVDDNGSSLTIDNSTLAVVGGGTEATAMRVTIASDSTGLLSIDDNGGSLTTDSLAEFAEDTAHVTADVGIQTLVVRNDTLASLCDTDGDYTPLQVNADGALYITSTSLNNDSVIVDDSAFTPATSSVTAMGAFADEAGTDLVDEGDIGAPRMTLDRKLIIEIADATTDSQRLAINASGEVGVVQATHGDLQANVTLQINDVDVSASVPVPISRTAAANSEVNPIYVYNTASIISGTEVHDYDTAAAVASDATSNHDYTVVGATMLLKSVIVSGSGNIKFEILTGPTAALVAAATGFLTGRQGDTKQVNFDPPIEVPVASSGIVRVIRTNRQGAATDVYSTIIGSNV